MLTVLLVLSIAFGCAKKYSEEKYEELIQEAKIKGEWDKAIKYCRDLIEYYPSSPKAQDHKLALADYLFKAAEKTEDKKKAILYYSEAASVAAPADKLKVAQANYNIAKLLEPTDSLKAATYYREIDKEQYDKMAQLYIAEENYQDAINCYTKLIGFYPKDPSSYKWHFMMGFIYSEYLDEPDKAKEYFKNVYTKFPECELADDAKFLYEYAGEDVEEIIFRKAEENTTQ